MQAILVEVNDHTYHEPSKMLLKDWLDEWNNSFLNNVKPRTKESYYANCENHIIPLIGMKKLCDLTAIDIQRFYGGLQNLKTGKPLSAKTVKNIHGTLHKALECAVKFGLIKSNPADCAELPKIAKPEIKPLDEDGVRLFIAACQGHVYERVYLITLFLGLRQGEILGLSWDCVDFKHNKVIIKQQLQKQRGTGGTYTKTRTKENDVRHLVCSEYVMSQLRKQKERQDVWQKAAGCAWDNPMNLVFTNELGCHLCAQTVYLKFKEIVKEIGYPSVRFHDLRHTFAVISICNGTDIKTLQANLGHYSAAFTLDTYGHVTDQMKQDSAAKMDAFIAKL